MCMHVHKWYMDYLPVVKFDVCVCQWVILEPHQMQVEDGRETDENHTFPSFLYVTNSAYPLYHCPHVTYLQAMFPSIILVLAIHCLYTDIVFKRFVHWEKKTDLYYLHALE